MKIFCLFFIICCCLPLIAFSKTKTEISSLLWSKTLLGDITQITPLNNENMYLIANKNGIVSAFNLKTKEIPFRKFFMTNNIEISANSKSILVLNNEDLLANVFSLKTGQLLLSNPHLIKVNSEENLKIKSESIILKSNANLHIIFSNKRVQIIKMNNVIYDSKVKDGISYLDYIFNEENNVLSIAYLNSTLINIIQIPLDDISKKQQKITQSLNVNSKVFNCVLTKDLIYIITQNSIIIYKNEPNNSNIIKSLDYNYDDSITITKNPNKDYFIIFSNKNSIVVQKNEIINLNKIFSKCKSSLIDDTFMCLEKDEKKLNKILFKENQYEKTIYYLLLLNDQIIKDYTININNPEIIIIVTNKGIFEYKLSNLETPIEKYKFELSSIKYVELIPYENSNTKNIKNNQKFISIKDFKINNIGIVIKNIINNLTDDIIEISQSISKSITFLVSLIKNKGDNKNEIKVEDYFKYSLFLLNENNNLKILDALTGKIKYEKQFEKDLSFIKIKKMNEKEKILRSNNKNVDIIFKDKNNKEKIYQYSLEKDIIIESQNEYNFKQILKENINYIEYDLVKNNKINGNLSKRINSIISNEYSSDINNMLINLNGKYCIEQINNTLYGFKFTLNSEKEIEINIIYNFNYEEIIKMKIINVNNNPIPTYLVNGKIFYKFLNENLIFVLSKYNHKNLLVSIINGENGKILKQIILNNPQFDSISFILEDNWAIISYIKNEKGFKRNEIFSLEILSKKIDGSLKLLFEKKIKDKSISLADTTDYENDIEILYHSFALERRVKNIYVSQSENNNANKYITFLLSNNKIYLMDRRILSPRRPIFSDMKTKTISFESNSIYVDTDLPGYEGILKFDYKLALDSSDKLVDINNIVISPTESESTFILCSTGDDVFCYKVFPDKEYDKLNAAFSYSMILIFMTCSCIGTYLFRKYEKKDECKKAFLKE